MKSKFEPGSNSVVSFIQAKLSHTSLLQGALIQTASSTGTDLPNAPAQLRHRSTPSLHCSTVARPPQQSPHCPAAHRAASPGCHGDALSWRFDVCPSDLGQIYITPNGQRLRSRLEVARYLGLSEGKRTDHDAGTPPGNGRRSSVSVLR